MSTLSEIRARLSANENRSSGNNFTPDNTIYPHWNIDEGKIVNVRFLPDGNPNNTFFWVERAMIRLEFAGIKGGDEKKPVTVRVPCAEMYGDTCPVLTEVRPWFKDKSLEETARKYWKKRDYFFQGFVRESPLEEENSPENPIRRFLIGPQIFNIVKAALMDPELEELPTDYNRGLDFRITKGSKGGYADYSTSTWARRESPLTAAEQAAIEQYGLFDLSSFLPKRPTEVELKVIAEMFEASVDGQVYDPERWSNYYRPAGVALPGSNAPAGEVDEEAPKVTKAAKPAASKPAVVETKASTVDEDEAPFDDAQPASTTATTSSKAEDILKLIRERQQS